MTIVIPYVAQTWTDGVSACSAARNNVHEDGIRSAHQMPAVRVFHSASQSVTSGTPLVLAFNSERYDQASGSSAAQHDTVTNNSRLTCLYAGVYNVVGHITIAANATGYRQVFIRLNGTTTIGKTLYPTVSAGVDAVLSVTTDYSLAVNDYVELVVDQNSGGPLNVLVAANYSPEFMMTRVA